MFSEFLSGAASVIQGVITITTTDGNGGGTTTEIDNPIAEIILATGLAAGAAYAAYKVIDSALDD